MKIKTIISSAFVICVMCNYEIYADLSIQSYQPINYQKQSIAMLNEGGVSTVEANVSTNQIPVENRASSEETNVNAYVSHDETPVENDVSSKAYNVDTYVNNSQTAVENDVSQPQSVDSLVNQ
ncbi:hypothetical protein OAO18_05690 [Francisellaceae bacterium]|nr:hypothetical protein [Francisellaceae bacterium]